MCIDLPYTNEDLHVVNGVNQLAGGLRQIIKSRSVYLIKGLGQTRHRNVHKCYEIRSVWIFELLKFAHCVTGYEAISVSPRGQLEGGCESISYIALSH